MSRQNERVVMATNYCTHVYTYNIIISYDTYNCIIEALLGWYNPSPLFGTGLALPQMQYRIKISDINSVNGTPTLTDRHAFPYRLVINCTESHKGLVSVSM